MSGPLAAFLTERMAQVMTLPAGGSVMDEVAHAVEAFCGAQRLMLPLPDAYLDALIHRALVAVGEADAAAYWAAERLPGSSIPEQFAPAVWPGAVPLAVWRLFASGAIRYSRRMLADGRDVWRLDFARIHVDAAGWLELTFYPGLRALLQELAVGWDAAAGCGVLGLCGLYATGFAPSVRRGELDAAQVRRYCQQVLGILAAQRGWRTVPEVVYLDLPPRPPRRRQMHKSR